jgi:UDP:flavonoid glycosyltransferase YjiC (YdhE family)
MTGQHIAFILESAHGHINPTLGIASQLTKRRYKITYAVKDYFAPRVRATGSEAVIYQPLENKLKLFRKIQSADRTYFDFEQMDRQESEALFRLELEDTLVQLECLYEKQKPDLIIYERMNLAGRSLAQKWHIPVIEHSPMLIYHNVNSYDENLVIVSLPRFYQRNADELDGRFQFIGPIFNDSNSFKPWELGSSSETTILVSATTGLLPMAEYFRTAIDAFRDLPWRVILSIGDELNPAVLGPIPHNFEINQYSSQSDILRQSCRLFIGSGGALSTVEALRYGVPVVLCPPCQVHEQYARRAAELGFGVCLERDLVSARTLRESAISVLENKGILDRVKDIQAIIQQNRGAEKAAEIIDSFIRREQR